jgi:hypothetical protein
VTRLEISGFASQFASQNSQSATWSIHMYSKTARQVEGRAAIIILATIYILHNSSDTYHPYTIQRIDHYIFCADSQQTISRKQNQIVSYRVDFPFPFSTSVCIKVANQFLKVLLKWWSSLIHFLDQTIIITIMSPPSQPNYLTYINKTQRHNCLKQ